MKAGRFSSLLKIIPSPEKRFFWLFILIIIKFSVLYFLVSEHRPTLIENSIAVCSGDCDSYLSPIDHFLQSGNYSPDYRMPGYGISYLLFRIFFQKSIASSLLIIFQTFLDALASLILAITAYKLFEKKQSFYLALLLYGLGITVSCYNNWILTESLTSSAFIFAIYFFVLHNKTKRNLYLLFSGIFFTWLYFLRPVNMPLLFIALVIIFFTEKEMRGKKYICFLLPAIIFQSMWTIRNYELKHKLFFLTENPFLAIYSPATIESWKFCKTFSDFKKTCNYFDKTGLTYYGQAVQSTKIEDIKLPPDIYTKDFNEDSLLLLRRYFEMIYNPKVSPVTKYYIQKIIVAKFNYYTLSIKSEHPFIVYVRTPLILIKDFILQSGVHNLFFFPYSYLTSLQRLSKLFFIIIYWMAFILFIFAAIAYPRSIINNKMILLVFVIGFYIIFIHSVFLRSIEPRYIIPAYPFFVTGAIFSISMIKKKYLLKTSVNG